jgi:hypothetical protein
LTHNVPKTEAQKNSDIWKLGPGNQNYLET